MSDLLAVGTQVRFVGFSNPDEKPDNGELLEEGEVYTIAAINEGKDGGESSYDVDVANPEYNPKKRKSAANSPTVRVDLFSDEVEELSEEDNVGNAVEGEVVTLADVKKGDVVSVTDDQGEILDGEVLKKTRAGLTIVIQGDEGEEEVTYKAAEIVQIALVPEDEAEAPAPEPEPAPAKKTRAKPAAAEKPAKATRAKATPKAATAKPATKARAATKGKAVAKAEPVVEDEDLKGILVLTEEEEDADILALIGETEDLCALASELVDEAVDQDYRLGGVLYHVRVGKAFRAYEEGKYNKVGGFKEYVETELNTSYRKAMYLIDIYTTMNRYDIDPEVLRRVGWTKMGEIIKVMDEKNVDKLIEAAESNTVPDLRETVKESYTKKGADTREVVKRITFKFRLVEDAGVAVQGYLEQAAAQLGHKKLDETFEHIIGEWAQEHLDVSKVRAPAKAVARGTRATSAAAGRTGGRRVAAK